MKALIKQFSAATLLTIILLGYSNANATGIETPVVKYEETSLSVENWMTDESLWNNMSFMQSNLVLEAEMALDLENWMISENFVGWTMELETEIEEALILENWMTDSNIWQ